MTTSRVAQHSARLTDAERLRTLLSEIDRIAAGPRSAAYSVRSMQLCAEVEALLQARYDARTAHTAA